MTLTDRPAAETDEVDEPSAGVPFWSPGWRRSGLIGVATALGSALLVVLPTVLAWRASPLDGSDAGDAVAVGASMWLLSGGARLQSGPVVVAFTPLLLLALLVLLARLGAREAMVQVSTADDHRLGLLPRALADALGSWLAGYVLVVIVGWVVAARGAFPPLPVSMLLPALLLPVVAAALALRPVVADDPDVLGPRLAVRVPDALRRGVGAGVAGVWLLLGAGLLVIFGALVLSWPQVQAVRADLAPTGAGAFVLDGLQVAALPNLALWVLSLLAGPGFSVVEGASVTWSGTTSGLLPMVPFLGALPQPGPFPAVVGVVSLLVVLGCGAWVGGRALRSIARLSRVRTKLAVATAACATTAVLVGLLDALAGGSLGQFRLASVGAPAVPLVGLLFVELLAGAVVAVLRDAWRLRR